MDIKDINKLRKGMQVRISNDPSKSIKIHGSLDGYKKSIAGTVQTIKKIHGYERRIFIENKRYSTISFDICDIELLDFDPNSDLPKIESTPQLFDPEQLDL